MLSLPDLCRQAVTEQRPLIELLAAHPEIRKHVDRAALSASATPTTTWARAV
ncbi:hypothetical protein JJB11_01250 [Ramlibacter ginsenosidimutans]|uniref:Uncharacterized protein n=1 Tax=Ramlibacter ginsenosidimutans TaxID=502333 RepID=A0A934TQB9_9BURK|nr:hypothetical protein [Ramlibacter ginsenosidimutans]